MIKMENIGAFCETYGNTINNRVLEYLLENKNLDFAVGDMAKELGISKPKAYEVIKEFEEKGYVKKSRIIGKTQLYILNKENRRVKLFLRDFKECLKMVVEEYEEKSHCSADNKTDQEKAIFADVYIGGVNIKEKLLEAV
jgi:sugar-specific transcriptional regulator TrmB